MNDVSYDIIGLLNIIFHISNICFHHIWKNSYKFSSIDKQKSKLKRIN